MRLLGILLFVVTAFGGPNASQAEEEVPSGPTSGLIDRLTIAGSIGYGYAIPDSNLENLVLVTPSDGVFADFLEAGEVSYSENAISLGWHMGFAVTQRTAVAVYVPFGWVQSPSSETLPGLVEEGFGVGDIRLSASYKILDESARSPELTAGVVWEAGASEYFSLGDGFDSMGAFVFGKKFVSESVYLLGGLAYEAPRSQNDASPGDVVSGSLGIGFLAKQGTVKNEIHLRYSSIGSSKVGAGSLDSSDSLSLRITTAAASERMSVSLYFTNIDDLDISALTTGVRYTYRFNP